MEVWWWCGLVGMVELNLNQVFVMVLVGILCLEFLVYVWDFVIVIGFQVIVFELVLEYVLVVVGKVIILVICNFVGFVVLVVVGFFVLVFDCFIVFIGCQLIVGYVFVI